MTKTAERYQRMSRFVGKVITSSFQKKDIITPDGEVKTSLTDLGDFNHSNPVPVADYFGVPNSFNRMMEVTKKQVIQKGQLNKPTMKARIANEGVESSRTVQAVVDANTIVGQIVKISKDNITGLAMTMESAAGILLDNFESYINSAALQAVWVASGSLAILDLVLFKSGSQSMRVSLAAAGDSWETTIPSTDYTDYTGSFDINQNNDLAVLKVYIQDSAGNKKFSNISIINTNEWQKTEVPEISMTEDPGNTLDTDVTDIVVVGFEVVTLRPAATANIDNLVATPPPGQIEVKLWNMGKELPVDGIARIDDGIQYAKLNGDSSSVLLDLKGGKRLYHLHEKFNAGDLKNEPLTNEPLIPGNHYILELKHVDTNVNIYGPDPVLATNYYKNGYAFTATDESSAISSIGPFSDIMFFLQSMQDVYIIAAEWRFDARPNGDSDIFVFAEDTKMEIIGVVVDHEESPDQQETKDIRARPMFLEDGGKLEFYYNDDFTDGINYIVVEMAYLYEQPIING